MFGLMDFKQLMTLKLNVVVKRMKMVKLSIID